MSDQNKDNLSSILEYPFHFEEYIQKRLREISDLDERRFAKLILLEGMANIIQCTEEKYKKLEKRVYEEIEIADSQYQVVMTIVKQEHYDPLNETLFLVYQEDVEEQKRVEILTTEKELYVGTIFLEMNGEQIRKFQEIGTFYGIYSCSGEERETSFRVCLSARYRKRMEQLYQVFQDNHVPWETMNTGYLDRFYDIYIEIPPTVDVNGKTDMERNIEVKLEDCDIWFGEYSGDVKIDMIPLWNLKWITFNSADFMIPCTDDLCYEHEFVIEENGRKDGYLIQTNEDILEIRHEKDKIIMKSKTENFEEWIAIRIVQGDTIHSLDYDTPLLTNHKSDSFFRRYAEESKVKMLTKTDLFRRIMELDIREYIMVMDYEIKENTADYPSQEGMNWFVRDELFPMESRKVLLLIFQQKKEHYLNESMVRFAISQIQLEISEYRCVGMLMEM